MSQPSKYPWYNQPLVWLVKFYRYGISPWKPSCCRFQPTCSQYALQALGTFGPVKAIVLIVWRIMRCHPFYSGPLYDPIKGYEDADCEKEHQEK